ncbi:hypothetical protein [Dyadobacter psychrotolerans]|uniref:Uncharacterized protein n=1 Tax=Dyadobacter psychrotolerans TaxID=2541721 RepID=A0A4R5DTJ8_9BACT|nr:hypothetical protein [Dyadobacter psychrotolerans]TDE17097.1 hypothetical protein E0F88_04130 [Dyadobacter psychrotolerans]
MSFSPSFFNDMKGLILQKLPLLLFVFFIGLQAFAQSGDVTYRPAQSSSLIDVTMKHERFFNKWFDSQNVGVVISNRTNDKLFVKLRFSAHLTCGKSRSQSIGAIAGDGILLMPQETIGQNGYSEIKYTSLNAAFGVPTDCRPAQNSKETNISILSSVDYQLISIENYSDRDRKVAVEQTRKKQEQDQITKLQEENESYQNGTQFLIDQLPANEKPPFQARLSVIERMSTQSQKNEYDKLQKELSGKSRQLQANRTAQRAQQSSLQGNTDGYKSVSSGNSSVRTGSSGPVPSLTSNRRIGSAAGVATPGGLDRSALPVLAMDKEGNHYVKDVNNDYHQVTAQQYQAIKQQTANSNAAANAAAKKAAADAALAELERNRVAAEMKNQQQKEELNRIVGGLTTMATDIINNERALREQREENNRRSAEEKAVLDKANNEKGDLILKFYLSDANYGNEEAIAKVSEAYQLKNLEEVRIKFLLETANNKNSFVATTLLLNHYSDIMKKQKAIAKGNRSSGIGNAIWTAVFAGGVVASSHYAGVAYDEGFKETENLLTGALIFSVGFGLFTCYKSIEGFARSNYRRFDDYGAAKNMYDQLEKRRNPSLSFAPDFNLRNKSLGLAARLRF